MSDTIVPDWARKINWDMSEAVKAEVIRKVFELEVKYEAVTAEVIRKVFELEVKYANENDALRKHLDDAIKALEYYASCERDDGGMRATKALKEIRDET